MADSQNQTAVQLVYTQLSSGSTFNASIGHVQSYLGFTQYSGSAVTIDNVQDQDIPEGWGKGATEVLIAHNLVVSVRVHTSYIGAEKKTTSTRVLVDQVVDRILTKVNLSSTYIVMNHNVQSYDSDFIESNTNGGSIYFNVRTNLFKTQR